MSLNLPTRMRRNRKSNWSRALTRETNIGASDLIWPLIVRDGENVIEPVESMPGVNRWSIDLIAEKAKQAADVGIPMLALFPYTNPELRDENGTEALNPDNLVCKAVKEIKSAGINIGLMVDVALDPYTTHGHDGLLRDGEIINDETIDVLCEQALVLARSGADCIGPSDMMDGRIGAIRACLEAENFKNTQIISYAAKYASAFYGPFRDAVGSSKTLSGDKKTYQMDPCNTDEALREVAIDIEEGADMVMVKPGLPYLDIIWRVKNEFGVPTFGYQVSGEYAMIKAASQNGWIDGNLAMKESLCAFKRAGADGILSYFAFEFASALK